MIVIFNARIWKIILILVIHLSENNPIFIFSFSSLVISHVLNIKVLEISKFDNSDKLKYIKWNFADIFVVETNNMNPLN